MLIENVADLLYVTIDNDLLLFNTNLTSNSFQTCTHAHIHTRTHTHTHRHTHTHMYVHLYIHTHIYIYTRSLGAS